MRTKVFILCILLLHTAFGFGQADSIFHLENNYGETVTDFTVDNLGNMFLILQNGQLKKLRPSGDSLAVFNNIRKFGRLYSVDVSNPLKVLLYYKDFGTVVILDRFLNERSTIDLRKQNLLQVKAVGQSYDNNIWIFDELESKLKKIGDDGRLIDQSNDFRMIFDSTPSPVSIIDQDKFVYLYDPAKGVYIFDYFGGLKNRIPFTGWSDFKVINNALFGWDKKFLYRYDVAGLQLQRYPVPSIMNEAQKVIVAPGMVYLLKDGTIMVYSYK